MLRLSFSNLFRNKTRTFLSIVGIVIGVASIIALVSIVDGLFLDVQGAVGKVQGLRVFQKDLQGPFSRITADFEQKIEGVNGVKAVMPVVMGIVTTVDGVHSIFGQARAFGVDYSKAHKLSASPIGIAISGEIIEGRDIKVQESGVVVIGEQSKKDYKKFLNQEIEINHEKFKIVGVYSTGSVLLNSGFMMSIEDARNLFNVPSNKITALMVELIDPQKDREVSQLINFRFGDEIEAFSASDFSEQFGDILGSLRVLTAAVAAISAIVAGVGIINTMLMSVIERFKEIGALKATGWNEADILWLVLIESLLIGGAGGLAGVIFGVLTSTLIGQTFGLSVAITSVLLLEVFAFAVFLGLIAGLYPAFVASRMDPVEALRTE